MSKLLVLASLSGGGKSTYAKTNYHDKFILPDTNVKVYEIYHKLFRGPALDQGLRPDDMTGFALWSSKYSADMAYIKAFHSFKKEFKLAWDPSSKVWYDETGAEDNFISMRSGWDFLIYDELWQNRKIMPEGIMFDQIKEFESQFTEVEYRILVMKDEKIIKELMSRNDDRSNLFNNDPVEYHRWQDYYVNRFVEIMNKFNYKYTIEEVTYS